MKQPTEAQAKSNAKAEKAAKKQANEPALPLLVEFTFTLSALLLIVVFLVMSTISWLNGATLLDFVLRTSVSILALGSLLMLISKQVLMGVLSPDVPAQEDSLEQAPVENIQEYESTENLGIPEA